MSKTNFAGKIKLDDDNNVLSDLLLEIFCYNRTTKPRGFCKKSKRVTLETLNALYDGRGMVLDAFKSEIFPLQPTEGTSNSGMLAAQAKVSDREVCNHSCKITRNISSQINASKIMDSFLTSKSW